MANNVKWDQKCLSKGVDRLCILNGAIAEPVSNSSDASQIPPLVQLVRRIDALKLKVIFVLVPFTLDCYSYLTAAAVPDVASTVGRLFAEGRLEVTNATLVVWACYPRELAARGDFSEAATRHHLHEELRPHIGRLRDIPPIRRVPGSGSSAKSCGVRPFREVEFRMCPYEEWHAWRYGR
ncbi:hypothetical protein GSI_04122 [Ganoderma sinense ZZ0214-1]|uniref:Uncharacterized protein n=1 Tax=Ganoderma sinense ZZ0214-1 TaxID=1077348 RepID=A0A2G8SI97_9APHY|nr:hypothetical protein GSI_04122 [Ganoderma sinense ZZ0214-1]